MVSKDDVSLLIERAIGGDERSLERLLIRHYADLARHIGPRIPSPIQSQCAVEDIVQETFVRAFHDIRNFRPQSEGSFFAWLKTIAKARLKDAIREKMRAKRGGGQKRIQPTVVHDSCHSYVDMLQMLSGSDPTASSILARREGIQALQVGLAGLPDNERRALQMRYLEQKSLQEVATALNRTEPAIRGLLHRGKKKLADAMGRSSQFFSSK